MAFPSGVPSAIIDGDMRKPMWHVDTLVTNPFLQRLRQHHHHRQTLNQSFKESPVVCIITKITRRSINADFTRGLSNRIGVLQTRWRELYVQVTMVTVKIIVGMCVGNKVNIHTTCMFSIIYCSWPMLNDI